MKGYGASHATLGTAWTQLRGDWRRDVARSSVSSRTRGSSPRLSEAFITPFLIGAEEAAEETGHDLLLLTSAATGAARSIHAGGENNLRLVDGAVLLGRGEIPTELEELAEQNDPFVLEASKPRLGSACR